MGSSYRTGIARLLVGAGLAWAALGQLPMPGYPLWYLHVVALETSLAATVLGALGVAAGLAGPARARVGRAARALAAVASVLGLLPLLTAWPLYARLGARFSPGEYLGVLRLPPVRVERDVRLDAGSPLLVDLYHAAAAVPRPYVIVIHGGSWRGGDKGPGEHVSRALAAAGYTVVDVQYRLAPEHPFPRAVQDVKCLAGRLRQEASALGIDPSRGAYLGRSAGGQIALVAAYSAGDTRIPPSCPAEDQAPQAVVSLYAPTDLAWGHAHPLRPDVVRGPESLELYLEGPPSHRATAYRLASPLSWADRPLPPTLLIHGSADRLVSVEHARRLESGLRARRQGVQRLLVPLAEHGFDLRPGGIGEQLARAAVVAFLGNLLRPAVS